MNGDDLAFTAEEADLLLRSRNLTLPGPHVERLHALTDGWPAALALGALSLTRSADPLDAASAFGGGDPFVRAYVLAELAHLDPSQQEALLATSVVDAVSPPLARALTEDDAVPETLAAMARAGYLVSDEAGWWHPHPLVVQALRAHLRGTAPRRAAQLSRRAATWFVQQGDLVRALRSSIESEDWALVSSLALDAVVANVLQARGTSTPIDLTGIPAPVVMGHAQLQLALAHEAWREGDLATARARLRWALTLIPAVPARDRPTCVVCHRALEALVARRTGDAPAVVQAATRALTAGEALPPISVSRVGDLGAVRRVLAIGELWSGRPARALDLLESLTGAAASGSTAPGRPDAVWYGLRANALLELGRLRRARHLAEDAVGGLGRSGGLPRDTASGWLALARLALLQGDPTTAATALTHGQMANGDDDPFVSAGLRLTEAERRLHLDQVVGAEAILRGMGAWVADGTMPAIALRHAALSVDAELAHRSTDHAQAILDRHRDERGGLPPELALSAARVARARRRPAELEDAVGALLNRDDALAAQAWYEVALAADDAGAEQRSVAAFARALDLALNEDLLRPFLRRDARITALLRRHAAVTGSHPDAVEWLLDARGTLAGDAPGQVEALTQRERTVLAYLATMRSNDEIAQELSISVNTVKQHLKSIHRKLGVNSRRDAVRTARRLNLLPRDHSMTGR